MAATQRRNSQLERPLSEVARTLPPSTRTMSLEELAAFLRDGDKEGATDSLTSLDDVARAILDLPLGRRRMREVERAVLSHALLVCNGNVSHAAQLLGVTRQAVQRRVRTTRRRTK